MSDAKDGRILVELDLDISGFIRGWIDAKKIADENMAQMKKDFSEFLREIKLLDGGMHAAGHWTAEDLAKHKAENEARFKIEPIKPDAEDLKEFQKAVERYKKQLANLQADLQFGDDKFGKARAKLDSWATIEMERFKYYEEGQKAVEELRAAKLKKIEADEIKAREKEAAKSAQIEQERADRIEEIRKSADSEFKTELENRIDKIEEEKDAWISAGMDEAEATELAQRRIAKARQDAPAEIRKQEGPIDASNVMFYDSKAKAPTRIGYTVEGGKKKRVSKKTGQVID